MNNQVWPKDLSAPLRQVERAVIDLIFWNELVDVDGAGALDLNGVYFPGAGRVR